MLRLVYTNRQSFGAILSTLVSYLINWRVATHFWSDLIGLLRKSKQFSQNNIACVIAALMLTLSVNGPLTVVRSEACRLRSPSVLHLWPYNTDGIKIQGQTTQSVVNILLTSGCRNKVS